MVASRLSLLKYCLLFKSISYLKVTLGDPKSSTRCFLIQNLFINTEH
jgi:hypothetical protein